MEKELNIDWEETMTYILEGEQLGPVVGVAYGDTGDETRAATLLPTPASAPYPDPNTGIGVGERSTAKDREVSAGSGA